MKARYDGAVLTFAVHRCFPQAGYLRSKFRLQHANSPSNVSLCMVSHCTGNNNVRTLIHTMNQAPSLHIPFELLLVCALFH